ncbi:hypothetical protein JQ615_11305 [Bradyrhizobium jicamae]|uniref:Uncharacterized protein n=1 Tax=Bradyrhizobium jicamae TaxID=280332 RepID=A0ABS5FGR9_9BRAD|nr:hypothetical protein [Bradyrhizobium jicamae]MBR0795977.1 hypothetical protein [Bradyrhizobium jicamae]
MRFSYKIEGVAVPIVHFEDAPAAGKGLGECSSTGLRDQLGQPHQIVGGRSEGKAASFTIVRIARSA